MGLVAFPGAPWALATTGPQLGQMQLVQGAHGDVLNVPVTGTADVTSVTVTATEQQPSATFTFTLSLGSGTATEGVWQSTGSLGLPFNCYTFIGTATDSTGQQSTVSLIPAGTCTSYLETPVFHDTVYSPTLMTPANPMLDERGRLTIYDPNSGDTGQPMSGISVKESAGPPSTGILFDVTKADGSFDLKWNPVVDYPDGVLSETFTLEAYAYDGPVVYAPSQVVSRAPAMPTRILLDHPTEAHEPVGSTMQIPGTVQYQTTDGVWHPFPSAYISLQHGDSWIGAVVSDANGRFTLSGRVPGEGQTWTANVVMPPWYTAAPTPYTFTVDESVRMQVSSPSVDQFDVLRFNATITSSTGKIPGGRVYVQESPDGKTGWQTLGALPVSQNITGNHISGPAGNPHGYWRLYLPASASSAAAYSNTIHAFRYATAFRGGKPTASVIRRGHTLGFTGSLWQQGYDPWTAMHSATVALLYRPAGSSQWYVAARTRTNSAGAFSFRVADTRSATWAVVYITPDSWHIDAVGPQTYVRVD
jgi:hypothetical protein